MSAVRLTRDKNAHALSVAIAAIDHMASSRVEP